MNRSPFLLISILFILSLLISAAPAQTYVSGAVSGVWDSAGSPYYVVSDVGVPQGSTLVIGPGVDITFMAELGFMVDTNAVLKAIGTTSDSVFFTGRDTTVRHEGISFYSSADGCTLSYCRIKQGGTGVICDASNPAIINNAIHANMSVYGGGIYCRNSSDPIIYNNTIYDNSVDHGGLFAVMAVQIRPYFTTL